jgi:hypothetical protein
MSDGEHCGYHGHGSHRCKLLISAHKAGICRHTLPRILCLNLRWNQKCDRAVVQHVLLCTPLDVIEILCMHRMRLWLQQAGA